MSGLRKSYGKTVALDGLDLSVADRRGTRVPRPERIRQDDHDPGPARPAARRRRDGAAARRRSVERGHRRCTAGSPTCPVTSRLWPNLTGGEVIDLLGRLRGGLDEKRRAKLLERFDLDPTKKARAYSKGNRQKVALIAALASDVELLLLDEPTSGLDPLMEAAFRECIEEERERRPHGAAVQPHPVRGRGAVRPGHDHPARPHGGDRHAGRPAPPDPDLDLGRAGRPRRPGSTGCPASTTCVQIDRATAPGCGARWTPTSSTACCGS